MVSKILENIRITSIWKTIYLKIFSKRFLEFYTKLLENSKNYLIKFRKYAKTLINLSFNTFHNFILSKI